MSKKYCSVELRAVEKGCFVDGSMQLAALVESQVVGCIDLYNYDPIHKRAQVGIVVKSDWRRKGCATSMLQALENLCCHDLHLHQLYCDVVDSNEVSLHLFVNSGYRQVGIMQEWVQIGEGYHDVYRLQKILS